MTVLYPTEPVPTRKEHQRMTIPLNTVVPATDAVSGLVLAVTIALAVTAFAALCMAFAQFVRTRVNGSLAVIASAGVLAVLVGSVVVGGALTRPPAAAADEDRGSPSQVDSPAGVQLPTLSLND